MPHGDRGRERPPVWVAAPRGLLASPVIFSPCQSSYSIHSITPYHPNPSQPLATHHSDCSKSNRTAHALLSASSSSCRTRRSASTLFSTSTNRQHPTTTAASSSAAPSLGSLSVHATAEASSAGAGRHAGHHARQRHPTQPPLPRFASTTRANASPSFFPTHDRTPTGNGHHPQIGSRTPPHHRSAHSPVISIPTGTQSSSILLSARKQPSPGHLTSLADTPSPHHPSTSSYHFYYHFS